jgi:hypothetical protein
METCQTSYKVLFHIKGYIRLEVPLLRKLSWSYLYDNLKILPGFHYRQGSRISISIH